MAVDEAGQFTGTISENRTRIWCYLTKPLITGWGTEAISLIATFISCDRLISILNPIKYRQLGRRYAYSCFGFSYLFATCAIAAGFFGDGSVGTALSDVIPCVMFFSPLTEGT